MMRNYLDAIASRVVVYDGGMGATLEQFELTSEDYGGLARQVPRDSRAQPPRRDRGRPQLDASTPARTSSRPTPSRARGSSSRSGASPTHTLEINPDGRADRAARRGRREPLRRRLDRPDGLPAGLRGRRRSARSASASSSRSSPSRRGPGRGRRRPADPRDRPGHPRGQGRGLRRARGLQGHGARRVPIHSSVSLLPNGGKMLLGTDISRRARDARGAARRRDRPELLDRPRRTCATRCASWASSAPLPVACIPNAGLPLQGPDGETIFPNSPSRSPRRCGEFVERFGVNVVGGCCGTTPEHIAAIVERVGGRRAGPRPGRARRTSSSMIAATAAGPGAARRRSSASGSTRRARARPSSCCSPTTTTASCRSPRTRSRAARTCSTSASRSPSAPTRTSRCARSAKKLSLTQPAPIQIDSTEPEVIERALSRSPGRAIVNSINLEAGPREARPRRAAGDRARRRADRADDRRGRHGQDRRAQARDRAAHPRPLLRRVRPATRSALIFDCLTFTLATGEAEWRPSARRDDRGHPRDQARAARRARPRSASRTSRSASRRPARAVLNSRLPAPLRRGRPRPRDGQPEPHHPVRRDLDGTSASSPTTSSSTAARTRWSSFIAHFEAKGEAETAQARRRPDRGHGARGGAALPHPAPPQGRHRGLDRPLRREDRRGRRRSTRCCCPR